MKNLQLAKKIKELRKGQGLSQESLSEISQLNLRTIQRIEAGETEARGDTLQRLAKALKVSPNDLVDWTEEEDRGFLTFLNLSALSFIAFPLLGAVVPLALWVLKKDKIKDLDQIGKKLLNFQISWCILICLPYVLFVISTLIQFRVERIFSTINFGNIELFFMYIPLIYAINIILITINAYRVYKGKRVLYQPAIPFLK